MYANRHRSRWFLPTVMSLVACGALVNACAGANGSSSGEVTIAKTSQNGLQLILIDIANEEGFFTKHGVHAKVVSVNGDAAAIPALTSGSVQFAVSTSTPFFAAAKKSDRIEAVAPISSEPPEQIIVDNSVAHNLGITNQMPLRQRIQALKGKHVAILDVGGGLYYTLVNALSTNGVKKGDVDVSAISPYTSMLAALRRHAVAAAAPAVPYGYQAVAEGDGVMLADIWSGEIASIRDIYFELLDVNRDYADDHAKTVRGVKAALGDAMNYIKTNPNGALKVAKKLLPNFSDAVLMKALTGGNQFPTSVEISQQDFQKLADFSKQSGVDPAGVSYSKSVWKG